MASEILSLGEIDLKYTEDFVKQLYTSELDRKDKILSSMTVVSSPITILFAAVAYLVNVVLDKSSDYISKNPDIVVVVYLILMTFLLWCIVKAMYYFHKLLAGESYSYIPDSLKVLNNILEVKNYCLEYALNDDGQVTTFSKANFVKLYAESAAKNCASNDKRLAYRQGVFRNTVFAVMYAALTFITVAVHREQPHIWNVSILWRKSNGHSAQTPQQPATTNSISEPASPGNKQPEAAPAPTATPASH